MSNSVSKSIILQNSKKIYKKVLEYSDIKKEDILILLVRKIIMKVNQIKNLLNNPTIVLNSNNQIVNIKEEKRHSSPSQNQKQFFGVQKNFDNKCGINNSSQKFITQHLQHGKQIFKSTYNNNNSSLSSNNNGSSNLNLSKPNVTIQTKQALTNTFNNIITNQLSGSKAYEKEEKKEATQTFKTKNESEFSSKKQGNTENRDNLKGYRQHNSYSSNQNINQKQFIFGNGNNNGNIYNSSNQNQQNNQISLQLNNQSQINNNYQEEEKSLPRKNIYRDNYLDLLIEAYEILKNPKELDEAERNFIEIDTSVLLTESNYNTGKDSEKNKMISLGGEIFKNGNKICKQCENKACTFVETKKSNLKNWQKIKICGKKTINICPLCYKAYKNKKYCFYCGFIYKDMFSNYSVDQKTWVECDYCSTWQHIECEEARGEYKDLSRQIDTNKNFKYMCHFCRSSKEIQKKDKKGRNPEESSLKKSNLGNKRIKNIYSNEMFEYQRNNNKLKKLDGKINPDQRDIYHDLNRLMNISK